MTKSNTHILDSFFVTPMDRKTQLLRSMFTVCVIMHEAGHALVAIEHDLPINHLNLPRFDAFTGPNLPGETNRETLPGVGLVAADYPPEKMVEYYLGGLLGELSMYDDADVRGPNRNLHIGTSGLAGDLAGAIKCIRDNSILHLAPVAAALEQALRGSRYGGDSQAFLDAVVRIELPGADIFRRRRDDHRRIARDLYDKWAAVGFDRYFRGFYEMPAAPNHPRRWWPLRFQSPWS
ncbi:hypothetical protein [Devosia sp.]|uniref:hypothetical protein n=1 Tax=Devosia sp. TaxID=1871048 RepID=UPI0019D8B07B|nr:hypothetical protein [Devosia sp.]MBE0580512.1 hypothetical protein [Devosia sp.]